MAWRYLATVCLRKRKEQRGGGLGCCVLRREASIMERERERAGVKLLLVDLMLANMLLIGLQIGES